MQHSPSRPSAPLLPLALVALAGPALAAPSTLPGDPPEMIGYEARLTDEFGEPLTLIGVEVDFRLYSDPSAGTLVWSQTRELDVVDGVLATVLGEDEGESGIAAAFQNPDFPELWLEVQLAGEAPLAPRTRMVSGGWSFRSASAAEADDVPGKHIHPSSVSIGQNLVIDAAGQWVGAPIPGTLLPSGGDLIWTDGNVGIGTSSPTSPLEVANPGGTAVEIQGDVELAGTLGVYGPDPMLELFQWGTQNADRMLFSHSPAFSDWGLRYEDAGDRFAFVANGQPAVTIDLDGGDVTPTGGGLLTIGDQAGNNLAFDGNELMARNNGAVAPLALNVEGGRVYTRGEFEVESDADSGRIRIDANPSSFIFSDPRVDVYNEQGQLVVRTSGTDAGGYFALYDDGLSAGVQMWGNYDGNGQGRISANRVVTDVLEVRGGADLAEGFAAPVGEREPGTVMVIDPEREGGLRASHAAYDRRVAGVVSGAGGVHVGLRLGQAGVLDGEVPVALTGRVYVRCSAENGPIAPGDLLTTAGLAGHAMRVTDHALASGATLGKAMGSLEAGTGLVLVLVNLQ